jgi:hypothetical protein
MSDKAIDIHELEVFTESERDQSNFEFLNATIFNYHRLAAIDIITIPKTKEILEICIYPLNAKYERAKSIIPFNVTMKPRLHPSLVRLVGTGISRAKYESAFNSGLMPSKAAELFISWYEKKVVKVENKKILPVTYDWASKKPFLQEWLGPKNFDHYFHFQIRDILPLTLFCNDWADKNVEQVPFPKVDFAYICSQSKVEHNRNDTLINCAAITKVYNIILANFYTGMILH